jgi:hypothetical protein
MNEGKEVLAITFGTWTYYPTQINIYEFQQVGRPLQLFDGNWSFCRIVELTHLKRPKFKESYNVMELLHVLHNYMTQIQRKL